MPFPFSSNRITKISDLFFSFGQEGDWKTPLVSDAGCRIPAVHLFITIGPVPDCVSV